MDEELGKAFSEIESYISSGEYRNDRIDDRKRWVQRAAALVSRLDAQAPQEREMAGRVHLLLSQARYVITDPVELRSPGSAAAVNDLEQEWRELGKLLGQKEKEGRDAG